jgi:hypothetical protein
MLEIEIVSRCVNAAMEWHERVYLKDKGARQSLMAAVNKAGTHGLDNVMLTENAFASYLAYKYNKKRERQWKRFSSWIKSKVIDPNPELNELHSKSRGQ